MIRLIFYLVFIVSVALTVLGIILTSRLRNRYRSEVFSSLLYFQIFIYAFGFYGIWGQVAVKAFLSTIVSAEILAKLSDMALLLGLPFLVFAWLMLVRFTGSLSGRIGGGWFILWFLLANFSILLVTAYFIIGENTYNTALIIKEYYIIMNIIHYFLASYLIHFPWKGEPLIHDYDRKIIAPSLFVVMILQCLPLFFYSSQVWLAVLFVFAYFVGNTFLPVYFNYGTLAPGFKTGEKEAQNLPFEEFCRKHDVSPRESEVIKEICNGLSNKEISGKLFISLQTVKDHTHHIYIKTNVKSRVQLINMVKDLIKA